MDINETLLQIAIGEKKINSFSLEELAELFKEADENRLKRMGIFEICKVAYDDIEKQRIQKEERIKRAEKLISEAMELLSIYNLELRINHSIIKIVEKHTGRLYNNKGNKRQRRYMNRKRGESSLTREDYFLPILKVILDNGGSLSAKETVRLVGIEVSSKLNEYDNEFIESGDVLRWEKQAQWAKYNLVKMGCISSQSKRGVWEITEEGKRFLKSLIRNNEINEKRWTKDIFSCIKELDKNEFTLEELYSFEKELSRRHPNNRHIKAKIRQQLQILRDENIIEFIGNGLYRLK